MSQTEYLRILRELNTRFNDYADPMTKFRSCYFDVEYVDSCIEMNEIGLAKQFMSEIYKINDEEILVYITYRTVKLLKGRKCIDTNC